MKNKKYLMLRMVIILVSLVFFGDFVSAEMINSPVNVSYDSRILDEFAGNTWVNIFFKLNNMSESDNLLSNFSESEFKFIRKSSTNIGGEITKQGFDKLINDSRVRVVYYNAPVHGTLPSCGDGTCDTEEDCENCEIDCGCSEQEKCIKGECKIKKVVDSKNLMGLWIAITSIIILVIIIYFIKKKK